MDHASDIRTAASDAAVTTIAAVGHRNCRFRFCGLARRHAISGPMPVSSSSSSPSGTFTWLKNGGPTVTLVPRTASEMTGNSVPHSTANAMTIRIRLLNRNAASRLTMDSSRDSAASIGQRYASSPKPTTAASTRKTRKNQPTLDCAKLWTLLITPLRVRNVPKIESRNEPTISPTFHFFSIPRFSWIITEWRNAVIVSHGRNDAFSTGSQAQ
jgi:hypothetical protein